MVCKGLGSSQDKPGIQGFRSNLWYIEGKGNASKVDPYTNGSWASGYDVAELDLPQFEPVKGRPIAFSIRTPASLLPIILHEEERQTCRDERDA